jgi:hypothetical protein
MEMIESEAFRTFNTVYYLFKSDRLGANVKLTLHKALNRSTITYVASPGNLPRSQAPNEIAAPVKQGWRTPARDWHMDFNLPYAYDYVTE